MNNVIIFASTPKSHITPLKQLSEYLLKKDYKVYCFSSVENKFLIEKMGLSFEEYEDKTFLTLNEKANQSYLNEVSKLWQCGEYVKGFDYFVTNDADHLYNIHNQMIMNMKQRILAISPEMIFRDSADRIGYLSTADLDIPVIGYITNNLYSEKFFETNPLEYYGALMNYKRFDNLFDIEYFRFFRKKLEEANIATAKRHGSIPLNTMHQFDPMNYNTIIFSTSFLQPSSSLDKNRRYLIAEPIIDQFKIESDVENSLKSFIGKNNTIVYIATGSIISNSIDYYKTYINGFSKTKAKIVISCKDYFDELNNYLEDQKIENIMIIKHAPQKYILSKASLFISSGGHNSIVESIFFEVPLLINPLTSEQRLNSLIVEDLGIGFSSYKHQNEPIDFREVLNDLTTSIKIKEKLRIYSDEIKKNHNIYKQFESFLRNLS